MLAPTGTTRVRDGLKNGQINSLSPGVFFYYYAFATPVANSTPVTCSQINTPLVAGNVWPDIPVQKDQILAYDSNCVRLKDVTIDPTKLDIHGRPQHSLHLDQIRREFPKGHTDPAGCDDHAVHDHGAGHAGDDCRPTKITKRQLLTPSGGPETGLLFLVPGVE